MSISQIFHKCEVVELNSNGNSTIEIEDDHKMDFYYLLKGLCVIEYEVDRRYDSNAANLDKQQQDSYNLTQEDVETQKDIQSVQKLGKRLSVLLLKPYFQTEVIVPELNSKAKALGEKEVEQVAMRYLEKPDSENEAFIVSAEVK